MILSVASSPSDLRTAAYELEFPELLVLYLERRRRLREEEAAALEREARALHAHLLMQGAPSRERSTQVSEMVNRLLARAQKLREPEHAHPQQLTDRQQAVMAGRFLPGV